MSGKWGTLARSPHTEIESDNARDPRRFRSWASLPQKPRTVAEQARFGEALTVMLSLYGSMTGTTVLQKKEIPPRP